jgi:isopenicillin N synthase-like dioxygenase
VGPKNDTTYPTPWPVGSPECQDFKDFMQSFFEECSVVHQRILQILEEGLHLHNNELVSLGSERNAEVRITHYPAVPLAELQTGNKYRIAEHTDVGILTLLFQDSVGGLEVEDQNNPLVFLPISSKFQSEMILNVADTLQRWTHNKLRSANHRVTYSKDFESTDDNQGILPQRYSVGYFGKANAAAPMAPLSQFLSGINGETASSKVEESLSAQEYYNTIHEGTSSSDR